MSMLNKIKNYYFNLKFRSKRFGLSKETNFILGQLLINGQLTPQKGLKLLESECWNPGVLVLDTAYYSMLPSVWEGAKSLVNGMESHSQFFTLTEARQKGLSEYVLDYLMGIGFIRSIVDSNRFMIPIEVFFYLKLKGGQPLNG